MGRNLPISLCPGLRSPTPFFEEFLKERGIRHKLIPIVSLKQNGKVERSHRTEGEFYNQKGFRKPAERIRELSRFLDFYSTITGLTQL